MLEEVAAQIGRPQSRLAGVLAKPVADDLVPGVGLAGLQIDDRTSPELAELVAEVGIATDRS
ncbi:hypothetical protein [Nannocystis bainbridge]|uniref:Uncharacterized protein n=1 Tax=Nannocystis bainbridge TaxID=2995303 RepID=A0ABT5E378_9BACT|nr:hypothetical protein [Nannocystis bainbridge]MDC0719418.1 hypothetical protein [Nannocystis bainbridge]